MSVMTYMRDSVNNNVFSYVANIDVIIQITMNNEIRVANWTYRSNSAHGCREIKQLLKLLVGSRGRHVDFVVLDAIRFSSIIMTM